MALLGNFGGSYTRTGDNMFTKIGNFFSYIPWIGSPISGAFGAIGTGWEGLQLLFQGKVLSAATAVAAGTASTATNMAVSAGAFTPLYWANLGSGVLTGRTVGDLASRKLTEEVIGGVTGVLGVKPTILRSYPAGIGSIGGGAAAGPGMWASRMTPEGQDPNAYYQSKMNGDMGQHVAELEAARARGGLSQGIA